MSDELDPRGPQGDAGRRRRRRRRRHRGPGDGPETPDRSSEWGDDLFVAGDEPLAPPPRRPRGPPADLDQGGVAVPASGRNPHKKRSTRSRRTLPGSTAGRRRRLSPVESDAAATYFQRMPSTLVEDLVRGLGGQVRRGEGDRAIGLALKALGHGDRLYNLVRNLSERERKGLAALLQCGGLAQAEEFVRELVASFGGLDRDWRRVVGALADRGIVLATGEQDGAFFLVVPDPIVDGLLAALHEELVLPHFVHADVRVIEAREFVPPLDFSITSLATYMDQRAPRVTQRHDIYRHDQEEMDRFFAQIWEGDSDLFSFHLDFLRLHGMVQLRGEYLTLERDVLEEWLQLEAEDQRDLVFRALEKRFDLAEWVLWAIHEATRGAPAGAAWVAERPLVAHYRRWKRGEDWRDRYRRGVTTASRTSERDSWSFTALLRCGLLELGQWGQEKFYRLSSRARQLLEPDADDGFRQFYLTPSFEIMAPAGLAPILLFRIGELADLVGCDRANTYKITEHSVERALERGWRRDDVLQFLRDNSQIGLPDNVEATLKAWIGHRGDVEFHDLVLMTVHRTQVRRAESHRRLKPYLLHRFAPGMYAVDRGRLDELRAALREAGLSTTKDVRSYPGAPEQVEARLQLQRMVTEARAAANEGGSGSGLVPPAQLAAVPGTRGDVPSAEVEPIPAVNATEARALLERAMARSRDVEMVYLSRSGQRVNLVVQPERIALKADAAVLVAIDHGDKENKSFLIDRIERLKIVDPA